MGPVTSPPLDPRIVAQFDDPFGGRTINAYAELLAEFDALPDRREAP